jgi:hypothetical protein
VSESSFYFHEQLLEALLQNENDTSFSEWEDPSSILSILFNIHDNLN